MEDSKFEQEIDFVFSSGSSVLTFLGLDFDALSIILDYILQKDYKPTSLTVAIYSDNRLPSTLSSLLSLEKLSLSQSPAKNIIDSVFELHNLTSLEIISTGLDSIPGSIQNLQKLEYLNLTGNKISDINENLYGLSRLKELKLSGNNIYTISDKILKLKKISLLELQNNQISYLPKNLFSLPKLEQLIIFKNKLKETHETTYVSNLKYLDISYNEITKIHESIDKLSKLETFYFNDNYVLDIEDVCKLSSLKYLYTGNNEINKVPNSISKLYNLEELDISGNGITKIPNGITALTSLKILDISSNIFSGIPDFIGKLYNLEHLQINSCKIVELPSSIVELKNLKILEVYDETSEHGRLKKLPDNIDLLENLEILDISNNHVSNLNENTFKLKRLHTLRVNGNYMNKLPFISNNSSLVDVEFEHNRLTDVPESIGNLSSLKKLSLVGNRLDTIPASINRLEDLEYLNVEENPLDDLPSSLVNLKKLKSFLYSTVSLSGDSLFKNYSLAEISRLLDKQKRERIRVSVLKIPDALKTAFQRYFAAFDDFWKDVTGTDIKFNVNKHPDGLEIEIDLSFGIEQEYVEDKLNQYFTLLSLKKDEFTGFLESIIVEHKNLNEKVIKAEVRVSQLEQDLKLAEFDNEKIAKAAQKLIKQTEHQVIRLYTENKMLKEVREEYKDLLTLAIPPQNITIVQNQENSQNLTNNNYTSLTINEVQDTFSLLAKYIPTDLKSQADNIQDSLDSKTDTIKVENDTNFKSKFRRFFKELSSLENLKKMLENINSLGENAPKTYENIKKYLQLLLEFSDKASMHETIDHIKSILENL